MKISEDTLSILSNFASIQGSIVVDSGSVLSSVSEDKTLLVSAVVDEEFPQKFGIYDLNEFLNASSLLGDSPSFSFEDDSVFINSADSNQCIRYGFADPILLSTCVAPVDGITLPDKADFKFELSGDNIKAIKKSSGVLNLPHVCFHVKGSNIAASVCDKSNKTMNGFDINIPNSEVEAGLEFFCTLNVDTLKLFPGDYDVSIYKAGICHFFNKSVELEYFIAPQQNYTSF
jgi:hypothetical protein